MLYLSIKGKVELTKPCCLHGEEKLILEKVEVGVWGVPLSSPH